MNTKYLFFDLDGTISFDGDTVSPENLEYILKAKEQGHKVFINTGRGLSHISKKIINALPWDGIIAGSAYLQYNGEVIYNKTLSKDSIQKLYLYCKEKNAVGIFEGVYNIYTSVPYPVTEILLTDENIDDAADITCITVLCHIEKEEAQKLFPDVETVVLPNYFEGNPKGHAKDTCMKVLAEKLGITPDDMIAFGDSENDERMFKYAGTSVAIGSVPKEFDSFITMHADSVAQAIKELFDIE